MALSKEEHDNILRKISETGGFTADMMDEIQKLRDDYDEREGMLKKYGETKDKTINDRDKDEIKTDGEKIINWKSKYEDLKKEYYDRFFTTTASEAKKEQDIDIKEDGEDLSFEELFEKRNAYKEEK